MLLALPPARTRTLFHYLDTGSKGAESMKAEEENFCNNEEYDDYKTEELNL